MSDKRIDKTRTALRKDAGWSWVILTASFLSQIIIFGLILCFGIYFVTLLEYFQCTKREVAVVGSIAYGTKCLTGLLSSILYRKLGCRIVVMLGGLISAIGCGLSFFATDLHHLYLTYGLINGFGLGLAYTPTVGILPDYFDKYRYFATAFATVGSAVGTLLFQPIFLFLIRHYGWQGSMLINAGLALQIVVCGCFLRSRTSNRHLKCADLVEISLLKDKKFWFLMGDCILWGGSIYIVFSMANSLIMGRGLSKEESAFLVSLLGLSNVIGRAGSSVIGNIAATNRPLFYAAATALFSLATLSMVFCHGFWSFLLVFAVYGSFFGTMLAQLAGVIMDLFGVSRLVNGLGYAMFAVGIGGISLPYLGGYLADSFGNEAAYLFAFGLGMVAAVFCAVNVVFRFLDERIRRREAMNLSEM